MCSRAMAYAQRLSRRSVFAEAERSMIMKQMSYRLAGLALVVAMLAGGVAPVSTQTTVPGIDKPVIVVTGEITGTVNWTSNNYYVLRGAVFVNDGATLNIAAGTRVIGEAGSVGTLIVQIGRAS